MVKNAGQSLIEILIALAVFTIVVTAAAMMFWGGSSAVVTGRSASGALEYARSGLEAARTIRDRLGCGSLANGVYGVTLVSSQWQFVPTSDASGPYTRSIAVSTLDANTKKITASVSWEAENGDAESLQLVQALSDYLAAGSDVGIPTGDWSRPRIVASIDIGPGNEGTGLAYQNKKIYMSGYATSKNKPDFFVFDVASPFVPALIGSVNIEEGLAAVAVSGSYAYGIEQNSSDFFTIKVLDPTSPLKISKLTLPGGTGTSLALYGHYAIAGTKNASGPEFFVIDIANPFAPNVVANLEIGGDVNVVSVRGSKAYVTTSLDGGEMKIVDITTPTAPVMLGTFNAPGTGQGGTSAYATLCGYAYLGRAAGEEAEFFVIDPSSPSTPTSLGSYDTGSQINGMVTAGAYAFLGTDDVNDEFKVLNMTNLASITLLGDLNLPQRATGLVYNNNYVYISAKSNDALKIITSSP